MTDFFLKAAKDKSVSLESGHAEEFMIKYWPECVADYRVHTSRKIKTLAIFLSHTPCIEKDKSPSVSRKLGNSVLYPESCSEKLKLFFKKGCFIDIKRDDIDSNLSWRIYYKEKFGSLLRQTEEGFCDSFSEISLEKMPENVVSLSNELIKKVRNKRLDSERTFHSSLPS